MKTFTRLHGKLVPVCVGGLLVSLLGVEEIVTLSRQAMEAEDNHPELLMPFYGFALIIFFLYCYPIARWTISLERKFMVKL